MRTGAPRPHQSLVLARASATKAVVVLLFTAVAVAPAAGSTGEGTTCTTDQTKINVAVGVTSKTATFVCGSPFVTLLPPAEQSTKFEKCFEDKECNTAPKLFSAVVGADVGLAVAQADGAKDGPRAKGFAITVQRLPTEAKTVYFQCSSGQAAEATRREATKCTVEVAIPARPAADTCAEKNLTITVEVDATQKSTTFNCGGDLTALRPAENTKVFKDDCSTEVSLETELPSATLTSKDSKNTLALTELPKADKTLCYKCVGAAPKSSPAQACTVKVKVPASGSQSVATGAGVGILAGVILAVAIFL